MDAATAEVTILDMAKKKSGGEHKTPRVVVNVPKPWWTLLGELASKGKQPRLWRLLDLIAREAEQQGLEHPKLPWEEDE